MNGSARVWGLVLFLAAGAMILAAPANVFLVESFFRQSRYDKALEALEAISPLSPRLMLVKAQCLHGLDRPTEALAVLERLCTDFGRAAEAPRARNLAVQILEESRDWEGEIRLLRQFMRDDGASAQTAAWRRLLAYTLLRVGRPDEALAELATAATPADLRTLVDILKESGRWQSYVETESQAVGSPARQRRLADLLFYNGDNAAARTHYEALVAAGHEDDELLERLLATLEAQGARKEALDVLQRLLRRHPADVGYHQKLGDVHFALGHLDEAMTSWHKIVDLNARDPQAYTSLAAVLTDHRLLPQALQVLREGQGVLGNGTLFVGEVVGILADLDRYQEAAACLVPLAVTDADRASELMVGLAGRNAVAARQCLGVLRTAMTTFPSVAEYYLLFDAVAAVMADGADAERELVQTLTKNFADQLDAVRTIASALRSRGRYGVALQLLVFVDGRSSGSQRVFNLMDLAEVEYALGRWQAALAHLGEVAASAGTPARLVDRALTMKGRILHDEVHDLPAARAHWAALAEATTASDRRALYRLQAARAAVDCFDFTAAAAELSALASTASSGLKAEVVYQLARVAALTGRFAEAVDLATRSLDEDPEGGSAQAALGLLSFLTVHLPPAGLPDEAVAEATGQLVGYLRRSTLLAARAMARYDADMAAVDPSAIPPALADEYLMLEADSARIRGVLDAERRALQRLCDEHAESPYRDGALIRLARSVRALPDGLPQARRALEEHLLTYPDSLRADEARTLLKELEASSKDRMGSP